MKLPEKCILFALANCTSEHDGLNSWVELSAMLDSDWAINAQTFTPWEPFEDMDAQSFYEVVENLAISANEFFAEK